MKKFLSFCLNVVLFCFFSYHVNAQTASIAMLNTGLNNTTSVVGDAAGIIYAIDNANNRIVKATTSSTTAVALSTTPITNMRGLALSLDGLYLYAASQSGTNAHAIYRITTTDGTVTLFAGSPASSGSTNGAALTAAKFNEPNDVIIDKLGNLYVSDRYNGAVRKITITSQVNLDINLVSTFIPGGNGFAGDGTASTGGALRLNNLSGIAYDETRNFFYLADRGNIRIRKVDLNPGGLISTIAGNGNFTSTEPTFAQNEVPGTSVPLSQGLWGLAVDARGNIYFSDAGSGFSSNVKRVRKIDRVTGNLSSYVGATASTVTYDLNFPTDVFIRPGSNEMLIANQYSSNIIKVIDASLPLNLLSFYVKQNTTSNILNWQTSNEINVDKFEVLQSNDGRTFNSIGTLLANNNNAINTYNFTDSKADKVKYYQLKIMDKDGRFAYSQIIAVTAIAANNLLSVFPNPANNILVVSGYNEVLTKAVLTNAVGTVMLQSAFSATTKTLQVQHLAAGQYDVTIYNKTGEKIATKKIIISR